MEIISHNTDKNGIEISFDYHVTDETKAWFRSNSFRWSKRGNVWWRPFSEEMWTKVHEYFKQKDIPVIIPNRICDICGKEVKRYGMGTHKRMKHGIVVKRVMMVVSKQGEIIERSIRRSGHVPVNVIEQEIQVQQAPVVSDSLKSAYDYLHNQILLNEKNNWPWVRMETIRNWSPVLFHKSGYVPDTFSTDKYIFMKVDATKYSYNEK